VVGLGHWFDGFRLRVNFGDASSSFFARWFLFFQRLLLLSVREFLVSQHHLINAISVEEEQAARPNLSRRSRVGSEQVRRRALRRTFQSVLGALLSLGVFSFLFPSNSLIA
jgi:hypothetical protein